MFCPLRRDPGSWVRAAEIFFGESVLLQLAAELPEEDRNGGCCAAMAYIFHVRFIFWCTVFGVCSFDRATSVFLEGYLLMDARK
jgi:hypothetical protein